MKRIQDITQILGDLEGVTAVHLLEKNQRQAVMETEESANQSGSIPVLNIGVQSALKRDETIVVLKTRLFRPPPIPTVLMTEELSEKSKDALHFNGKFYGVIGEELIDDSRTDLGEAMYISKDFVMFPKRRRDPKRPALFILPPVPFPELEMNKQALSIGEIISASPSTLTDRTLRQIFGMSLDESLATLIVAFNWI